VNRGAACKVLDGEFLNASPSGKAFPDWLVGLTGAKPNIKPDEISCSHESRSQVDYPRASWQVGVGINSGLPER